MQRGIWLFVVLLAAANANLAAHGGGLDKYGCHRNNKESNYHCHQGPDAGKRFASKEAYEEYRKGINN